MSIKGTVADEFDIAFPTEKMAMATYPELVKDEVCLVFLNGKTSPYHFLDLDNATMQLGAESITMQPKQTPEERLIAELLAYAKLAQGTDRVAAIAALGQLAAKDALAQLNAAGDKHQDLVEYAQSLIARVQANDAPSSNELLAFFRRDDKEYDDGAAIKKYGSTGYSLLNLHIKLLMAVCNSVKTDPRQANAQVTKLANFPYVDFFHQVLQKDFVKHYENGGLFIGQALRNLSDRQSIPLLIELLNATDFNLRYCAVTALARINQVDNMFPSTDLFRKDEHKYLSYWREWWQQHKEEYKQ